MQMKNHTQRPKTSPLLLYSYNATRLSTTHIAHHPHKPPKRTIQHRHSRAHVVRANRQARPLHRPLAMASTNPALPKPQIKKWCPQTLMLPPQPCKNRQACPYLHEDQMGIYEQHIANLREEPKQFKKPYKPPKRSWFKR
ncbi:hypothetical protein BDV95DRAFT_643986 [Massariosphaeria phaeospora]|uniref:Uncharacterized protein n=1 Tax=Massariosphaeria phaeospora TaxID=100035 RepID=A0A7C8MFR1_9PLEO|nr:hypothetical protein BDV95DRAFT_643986 [Massariosphaeria phaeospora]